MSRAFPLRGLLVALALFTPVAARAESSPSLAISAPSTKLVDPDAMTVSLQYNLTGGVYDPADVVFVVPAGALYQSSSFPPTFTHGVDADGVTHHWRTANAFNVDNTGTAGGISVSIKLPTWTTLAGTEFTWNAHIGGLYTPTGGNQTSLAVAAAAVKTTATTDAFFGQWNAELRFQSLIVHPTLGAGLQMTIDLRNFVQNWQPLAEGYEYEFDLGANLYFVRSWPDWRSNDRSPPGDGTLVIDHAPADFSTTAGGYVHAYRPAGATPGANDLTTASNSDYPYAHAPHLYVDVFVPCTKIPLSPTDYSAPGYRVTIVSRGQLRTASGLGPLVVRTSQSTMSGDTTGTACFAGGGLGKRSTGIYGENRWDYFNIGVNPPKAAQPIDGMIVDVLPTGWSDIQLYPPPGFIAYFCVLPSGSAFSLAAFETSYSGHECTTTKPAVATSVTHAVFYDPTWGSGGDGIGGIDSAVYLYLPLGFVSPGPTRQYSNTAYFEGLAELDGQPGLETIGDHDLATTSGSTPADAFQSTATHTITAGAYAGSQDYTNDPTNFAVIGPGEFRHVTYRYYIDSGLSPAKNPHITVAVPAGVVLARPGGGDPITTSFYAGGECDAPPTGTHLDTPTSLERPLSWQLGDAGAPYYLRYYCLTTDVSFTLDDTYPLVDGTTLDFVAHIGADNEIVPNEYADTHIAFHASIPPEVQVQVKPACQQTPVDDQYPPAFVVSTENTGGQPLTNVTTTFKVPRAGIDGGVGGAIFGGVDVVGDLPAGAKFQTSIDGGASWRDDLGPDAAVTHVRLGTFGSTPFAAPVAFVVRLSTSASPNQTVVGRASVTSTEIPFGDSGPSEAFIVGSCHQLTVTKFFDTDRDGMQDGNEVTLAGFDFTVANDGVVIASGTTGAAGTWSVVVPAATYDVTEHAPGAGLPGVPATSPPIWEPTTPHAAPSATQSVTIAGSDEALGFGNNCSCADTDHDLCTYAICQGPVADGARGGSGNATIADVTCKADTTEKCEPQSACGTADCDPATGACSYGGPTCEAVDFFIAVKDAAGNVAGNAHCVLEDGAAPICDMQSGLLKIYPVGDLAGDTCGLAVPALPE